MKDWHADQIIAVGAVASLILVVIGADIVAVMTGNMDIMSFGREIAAGLFGYIGRGFVQTLTGKEPCQTLGKISETAAEAQNVVDAINNIKDIVKNERKD